MRNAFAAELLTLAEEDPRVVLLSGDIGNRLFDNFKAHCRERFFNCGVAEANMIGVAAGLAMNGLKPVAYTITPFVTTRCLEQIRVDLCYHNVPVVVVGVGGGLSYASLGATHHSCEDIAFLRALPNMTVLCPGDAVETRLALRAALGLSGPAYIRIGKKGEPVVHQSPPRFEIGKGILLKEGKDVCLLSTGNTLPLALASAEILGTKGISIRVVSLHTVKPLDEELLRAAFSKRMFVATLEEHSVIGGLGGAVAEWLADHPHVGARLLRLGTPDEFLHEVGEQEHAREFFGLTPEAVSRRIEEARREQAARP
ncbi:MAG: transketolase [Elusimicrobia bacterium]|nr:transketolase [Elusimicrobiota bacterium]